MYVYRWLLSTSVDPNQMLNNSPSIINQGPCCSLLQSLLYLINIEDLKIGVIRAWNSVDPDHTIY